MSAPRSIRYEMKFLCWGESGPSILSGLRLHSAAIRRLHPSRSVQSVYLDTADGRAVRDNLDGLSQRTKIRFRWYGTDAACVRGQLV